MRRSLWITAALFLLGLGLWSGLRAPSTISPGTQAPSAGTSPASAAHDDFAARYPAFLPPEAHDVLQRIDRGGPFEYRQDGGVFQNRERRLPSQPRGYYREYTVETPGAHDRGPRRLVTGGDPPIEYWYTDDHYRSFRGFKVRPAQVRQ
jgi:guanyl-specific ribonuclease Sa